MPLTPTAYTGRSSPDQKNAIGYAVGHDIQVTADPNTVGYTVTLTVDGEDATIFEREMLGYTGEDDEPGKMNRILPEPCGYDPRAYCVKLESIMHIPDALNAGATAVNGVGWPTYQLVSYRATYAIPMYNVLENSEIDYEHERFCVWRTKVVAQNEKIPGGGFQFIGATAAERIKLPEVGVKTGRILQLNCKWLDVPFFDYETLSTYCNAINISPVIWNGNEYPAETVLVTGMDAEPRINAIGERSFDITFDFAVRADGRTWNKFWKNGTSGYVEVSDNGETSGNRPFEKLDLNLLWNMS
jgi:hypothetical protein